MLQIPIMFLSEWREFPSAPCLAGGNLMRACVSMLLKWRTSLHMLTCLTRKDLRFVHKQTHLSNDIIDSVLRHRKVDRSKDLSAPSYVFVCVYVCLHVCVCVYLRGQSINKPKFIFLIYCFTCKLIKIVSFKVLPSTLDTPLPAFFSSSGMRPAKCFAGWREGPKSNFLLSPIPSEIGDF